jgi:uncharacterized protein (UPF0335 family)
MPKQGEIKWVEVVAIAASIVKQYDTGVTLRQLFYRLVSAQHIPNTQNAYKRLSKMTAEARREGWFPDLVDNTRGIQVAMSWDTPEKAIDDIISAYRRDRTEGQEYTIYLGVEKNALRVQLQGWFRARGIPVLAFGGYPSQTFVDDIIQDIERRERPAILLYGGDFDATGVDILRDFKKRTAGCWAEITRLALNEDQIAEYRLPPLPGKSWDPRAESFIAAYGELIQVELDALPPDVLKKIYEDGVAEYWDSDAYDKSLAQEEEDHKKLLTVEQVRDVLAELSEMSFEINVMDSMASVSPKARRTRIAEAMLDAYYWGIHDGS